MTPGASIVVPVHGRAELTRRCLEAALATTPPDCETIVVDDASEDHTPALLAEMAGAIRPITLDQNAGFATACNEGAKAASADLLVFLNNDTKPLPGWLDALLAYAEAHPHADVVGAKLLYPDGSVQHAGVVFGQDGYPHNLYAGFPGDHPAASRSRRLQAVTGACMLVRRKAFEAVGGFDTGFHNSLEDVDLCLRIADRGGQIHICGDAVVEHLESASRGRQDRFTRSVELYRDRWRDVVRRDDLEIYAADGLIDVTYPDRYPVSLSLSPHLAVVDDDRHEEIERLLGGYASQVTELLHEVVRLTTLSLETDHGARDAPPDVARAAALDGAADFLALARDVEAQVLRLQIAAHSLGAGVEPSARLGYRQLVEEVRTAVVEHTAARSTVLMISRGDDELVRLDGRTGLHFPQDPAGRYSGHHPARSADAVAELERLREIGADYIVVPSTSSWWLEHYRGFASHLEERYTRVTASTCEIFRLTSGLGDPPSPSPSPAPRPRSTT